MNNLAAAAETGEILCLLNNDIEMHDGGWLEAMVCHAMRPGVGAVGALLQYPDGTVQHAGVAVGTGNFGGRSWAPQYAPPYPARFGGHGRVPGGSKGCL